MSEKFVRVIKPGLLTTIQDLGRYQYQQYGVVVGGAMDSLSLQVSNLLVGNYKNAAALEVTLIGPVLQFSSDTWIAVCGADFNGYMELSNQEKVPLALWRPVLVPKGAQVHLGASQRGARSYMAVEGGICVEPVLGSKSTYLRAGIGGWQGRALQSGDALPIGPQTSALSLWQGHVSWSASHSIRPHLTQEVVVRVVPGPEYDRFTEESQRRFFSKEFLVTPQSDRMGYRLQGPSIQLEGQYDMLSDAIVLGAIQVPPDGQPIVLMADRQTTGGYPRIGVVATIDIPLIAQLRPGQRVRFIPISIEQAQKQLSRLTRHLQELEMGITLMRRTQQ